MKHLTVSIAFLSLVFGIPLLAQDTPAELDAAFESAAAGDAAKVASLYDTDASLDPRSEEFADAGEAQQRIGTDSSSTAGRKKYGLSPERGSPPVATPGLSTPRDKSKKRGNKKMSAKSVEVDKFAEYAGIKEALRPYIESAKSGNGKAVRPMFYDYAYVVGSLNGECMEVDADTFVKALDEGGPSPDVEHHIAWIDVSGPAAAVKLEFVNWHGNRFTDFFVLYKDGSQWKVSGKVFDAHANN